MKLKRTGFTNVEVVQRQPFGLEQAEQYPVFTPEIIDLMRRLIPADRQGAIAFSTTFTARNPG
ncbi:MAG: hypothetical protein ACRDVL_03095 [Acidimicrobiia bacterium]